MPPESGGGRGRRGGEESGEEEERLRCGGEGGGQGRSLEGRAGGAEAEGAQQPGALWCPRSPFSTLDSGRQPRSAREELFRPPRRRVGWVCSVGAPRLSGFPRKLVWVKAAPGSGGSSARRSPPITHSFSWREHRSRVSGQVGLLPFPLSLREPRKRLPNPLGQPRKA